ncbi:SDR family oxidoreductase [Candidatus Calescamantes bacterium]|nr:SDR family oxidoreductase [Candidatus Calescamantes bacterium]
MQKFDELKEKNILVTGGAGFIGSHIVEKLVEIGAKVKVLDNFFAGKLENLNGFRDKVELIEGDITDLSLVYKAMEGIDYVSHQAALRSAPKSVNLPLSYNRVNVEGTINILIAAKERGVKRVVYASSSSVYGDNLQLPQKEKDFPSPLTPYATSKLAGEFYCKMFTKTYGLPTVSLRYFNVFGPRQSLESQYAVVIPKFIKCILDEEPPPIHGDGKQSRDFTYIDNVVYANLLALTKEGVDGEIFNTGEGKTISILELVDYLSRIAGKEVKPVFTPPRPGDPPYTMADIEKVSSLLGYKPLVSFEEGLKRTFIWFKRHFT